MATNADGTELADVQEGSVSVGQLYREMVGGGSADDESIEQRSEAILAAVTESLFEDGEFEFAEETVKSNLDEILLMLVALRDSRTHGKGLMEDLESVFGADLSPGTVYPRLHELEDDDVLEVHELVRTKEYRIDDEEACRETVAAAMREHLALGFFFRAALEDL
ncbi:PadR family transcriptional regulator [Halorarius halobius]|uniref:PadR family transcriptional regulator n=1 Tax=Halorarius halobius TaxID=2962671 RepID=UPI0020CF1864|nr:helix-turn-helix transcriptional regulator [Halorarius halobius]